MLSISRRDPNSVFHRRSDNSVNSEPNHSMALFLTSAFVLDQVFKNSKLKSTLEELSMFISRVRLKLKAKLNRK
jgi:hypothetical protein